MQSKTNGMKELSLLACSFLRYNPTTPKVGQYGAAIHQQGERDHFRSEN
jgi:hypothetical protein